MFSTAGGSWSVFGLAGEQEKWKIARMPSEDVACAEHLVCRDPSSTTSGTQDRPGPVTPLAGDGPVPRAGGAGKEGASNGSALRVFRRPVRAVTGLLKAH